MEMPEIPNVMLTATPRPLMFLFLAAATREACAVMRVTGALLHHGQGWRGGHLSWGHSYICDPCPPPASCSGATLHSEQIGGGGGCDQVPCIPPQLLSAKCAGRDAGDLR